MRPERDPQAINDRMHLRAHLTRTVLAHIGDFALRSKVVDALLAAGDTHRETTAGGERAVLTIGAAYLRDELAETADVTR